MFVNGIRGILIFEGFFGSRLAACRDGEIQKRAITRSLKREDKKVRKDRGRSLGWTLGLVWAVGCFVLPQSSPAALADRLWQGARALASAGTLEGPGRRADFELYARAETLESLGRGEQAKLLRRELAGCCASSPLVRGLVSESAAGWLSLPRPDPDYSRLIKSALPLLARAESAQDRDVADLAALLQTFTPEEWPAPGAADLRDFLSRKPDSPYAGWAAYQAAWEERLQPAGSAQALEQMAREHPDHPLGAEAALVPGVPWFSPSAAARASALVPGRGEAGLEPGGQEFSGRMYSEILYGAAALGLALSSRPSNRPGNLAGALIFANLLFWNHFSSSEEAYALALSRNRGERRRWLQEHLENPVLGTGSFSFRPEKAWSEDAERPEVSVFLVYSLGSMLDGFRGLGWVEEQALVNLGVQAEGALPLWSLGSWGCALYPFARGGWNQAPGAGEAVSRELQSRELSCGAELGIRLRVPAQGEGLEVRLSLGPGIRGRSWALGPDGADETRGILSATAGLRSRGLGPAYWEAQFGLEEGGESWHVRARGTSLALPGQSRFLRFGMGMEL